MDRYSYSQLIEWYALDDLDGVGNDDRRMARICNTIEATIMNALRLSGNENVKDHHYHGESFFMPRGTARKPRRQGWNEMRGNLGFS